MRSLGYVVITTIVVAIPSCGASPASSQNAPQCSSFLVSRDDSAVRLDKAWVAEKARLSEQIDTLKSIREDLKADEQRKIGDLGSPREIATYTGQIIRTTTDLIKDLARVAGPPESAIVDALDKIQAAIDGDDPLKGVIEDKLSELSPYVSMLIATKNLAENMQKLTELPSKLDEARKTVGEQLEALNNQLTKLQPKLDQMKLQDQDQIVDRLFARATRLQRTCEDLSKKTDDCEKTRKSFVTMMCMGSPADKSACVADSYKEFNCGSPPVDIRLH